MIELDGAHLSGSGTIVRQAVAFSALRGVPLHVVNARAKRPKPGLRPQHVRVVEAIREVVQGSTQGAVEGSQEFTFYPGKPGQATRYEWDIGSAGSTTMLALAVLPVLTCLGRVIHVTIRGGLFQDYAPSVFHLQHVIVPLLRRMGLDVDVEMQRPGYVPRGGGELCLTVRPAALPLASLSLEQRGSVQRIWGIAFSSHLETRRVSQRMAEAAIAVCAEAGYCAHIEPKDDQTAPQPGAALAVFADCAGGIRLGADRAGAPNRRAEMIGRDAMRMLLEDLATGATVDRFAADQLIPFAALAKGTSQFLIPAVTDHVQTQAWLVSTLLGATVQIEERRVSIQGIGFVG
ncbi:MAG: RNA 3'-phosphate cyclase [Nitrospirae bacterium]|nr:MAG: RNA 3'-phosphate cyclase [Nitrospirota bacterium]